MWESRDGQTRTLLLEVSFGEDRTELDIRSRKYTGCRLSAGERATLLSLKLKKKEEGKGNKKVCGNVKGL